MGLFGGLGKTILGAVSPWTYIGGELLGAGMDYLGAQEQNQSAASIADKQMAFQAQQSGSIHQREVADLKAAGLNPVLSANAGAPAMAGASAPVVNELSGAAGRVAGIPQGAIEYAASAQNIRESKSRENLNNAQSARTALDASVKKPWARMSDWLDEMLAMSRSSALDLKRSLKGGLPEAPWKWGDYITNDAARKKANLKLERSKW